MELSELPDSEKKLGGAVEDKRGEGLHCHDDLLNHASGPGRERRRRLSMASSILAGQKIC